MSACGSTVGDVDGYARIETPEEALAAILERPEDDLALAIAEAAYAAMLAHQDALGVCEEQSRRARATLFAFRDAKHRLLAELADVALLD